MNRYIFTLIFIFSGLFLGAQTTARGVDFSVFPNPTTEFISVVDANNSISTIEVYNLVGKKVKTFAFHAGEKYVVADLPKGMYLVRILDKEKSILSTQKVNKR